MTDTAGGAHAASNPHSGPVPTGDHPVTEGGLDVRAVNAMLRLAAAKGWRDPKLVDIAREAGISLSDLVTVATSKTDLLALWSSEIDREVLAEIEGEDLSREAAHDRLFDVLMLRFDVMARHKSALIALHEDLRRDPVAIAALVRPTQRSLALMLEAAGIDSSGPSGFLKVQALSSIMAGVYRVWLWDGPEQAKTMAELDRRMRRAEGWGRRASRLFRGRRRSRAPERPKGDAGGSAPKPSETAFGNSPFTAPNPDTDSHSGIG